MNIHPKIKTLIDTIKNCEGVKPFSIEALNILKLLGATGTEASITLHLGFNINLDDAWDFVLTSNIFSKEEIDDIAYLTLLYLF